MSDQPCAIRDLARRLRPLGRQTRFARYRVRKLYDDWLADRRLTPAPANFLHAIVSTLELPEIAEAFNPADDRDALTLALAALGASDRVLEFLAAAAAEGVIGFSEPSGTDPAAAAQALMEEAQRVLEQRSTRAILHSGSFHRLTTPDAYWTDPGHLLPAILLARRRLCKIITVGNDEKLVTGTGFLIGPSTVLTNYHVVEHLPEEVGRDRLRVRFDFSATTGLESSEDSVYAPAQVWRAEYSLSGSTGPDKGYWWDDKSLRDAWLDEVQIAFDYAAIRLDGAPGLQRGWYRLDQLTTEQPSGVWVLHHPSEEQHTVTTGAVKITKPGGHRIFHLAPTVGGSSGGLVLDQQGRPIGLHYLGLEAQETPEVGTGQTHKVMNVAIALRAIGADLESKKKLSQIVAETGAITPFRGCLDGRQPVFGRRGFLQDLERLWRGQPQIMMVHVEPTEHALQHPGKSFTIECIRHIFRTPENHHIVFRAGDIKVDALRMARDTLRTFAPDLAERMPEEADTTTPAYIRKLVIALGSAIRERLNNRIVWIMLDDLDKHTLSNASGREFLATLYNQIQRLPNVRVILIGLPSNTVISGLQEENVIRSWISVKDFSELEEHFIAWLNERGARDRPIPEDAAQLIARAVTSYAGREAPLLNMAQFVSMHIKEVADELFGAARPPEGEP